MLMAANSTTGTQAEAPKLDQLAVDRTRLAHERTMMAWIRTSASMISFGFGIYKFFDYFSADRPVHQGFVTPRRFAIFLIATGLLVLVGAAVQHWKDLRNLRGRGGHVPRSLAGAIAALISIMGIFALLTAILRD
jgi:putative membrane protein